MSPRVQLVVVRIAIVLGFPVIVPWAFISCLCREIWSAFAFAWLEVRITVGDARRIWRTGEVGR